jgi:hypothetical protein
MRFKLRVGITSPALFEKNEKKEQYPAIKITK